MDALATAVAANLPVILWGPPGTGILFLDELTTAPPAVQAAMLRVVLERAVGDLTLPPAVRVVAAANPPEQAADGWDLTAPLANRFVHLEWRISAASVADGFTGGFPAPRAVVAAAPDPAAVARARALVAQALAATTPTHQGPALRR